MYQLIDFFNKKPVKATDLVFTDNETPWEILMDLDLVKDKLALDDFKLKTPKLTKYLPLMPIKNPDDFISLQETATPLVNSKNLGKTWDIDLLF